jgi:hypothetical protein
MAHFGQSLIQDGSYGGRKEKRIDRNYDTQLCDRRGKQGYNKRPPPGYYQTFLGK